MPRRCQHLGAARVHVGRARSGTADGSLAAGHSCAVLLLILGLAWFLASLGVYYRDVNQFLSTLVTASMFLSPIFYPLSALPEWLRPWVAANPLTYPVETVRAVLIFGTGPDLLALVAYTMVAMLVATLGYTWFQKTRRGFADVL